jgi:hypothetical protein
MARKSCVVLVPMRSHVEPDCQRGLVELEARGYEVRRVSGHSAIDQGRSQMATDALADGFDEIMWIDSDTDFDPDSVDHLRSHDLPFVSGIYVKKNSRSLTLHLYPDTEKIVFGSDGGLLEVRYVGAGFLLTRREVYETMQRDLDLPVCNLAFDRPTVPYFLPMIVPNDGRPWYLGEDFAFSERAHRCGFTIHADSSFRLRHIGQYGFSWEDAGRDRPQFANYTFTINR